jgi:outer membrane protein assembly factor BamB
MPPEPRQAVIQYPGAIRARLRWGNSNQAADVFALSEVGGALADLGALVSAEPDALCRAELHVDAPGGAAWTVRLASPVYDEPAGILWDTEGLLVVAYGFRTYAFVARTGALRWSHRSGTPLLGVFASSRVGHILVQSELETFAFEGSGEVVWRRAHSDVVVGAELVGGRLVLTSFDGQQAALDPVTGRSAA